MAKEKALAMILAGGAGGRLGPLTQGRAKPAMPYAGVYRLIDFPLSNCVHSDIKDVWVVEQYQAQSLNDQLAKGRPWDLDRTYGGLRVLQPRQGGSGSGFHGGNADAIYKNRDLIRQLDPELLIALSADHVYKLDYRLPIERHRERGADVTIVTTRVPREQASRFGVVEADAEGKVTGFEYKPDEPKSDVVTTEVFVYGTRKLLETLEALVERHGGDEESSGLSDFGDELLPELVGGGNAWEHRLEGYWKDVGQPASLWEAHMDLLDPDPKLALDDASWPILTLGAQRLPALIHGTAHIENSLIAPGCVVRGEVVHSVLATGVTVEEGAVVRDAVVLHNAVIGEGASVQRAIVDDNARIAPRTRVGAMPEGDGGLPADDEIALVGSHAHTPADTPVEPGARLQPDASGEDAAAAAQGAQ